MSAAQRGYMNKREADLCRRDGTRCGRTMVPDELPEEIRRHGLEGMSYAGRPLVRTWRLAGVVDGRPRYVDVTDPAIVEEHERSRCPACGGGGMVQTKEVQGNVTLHFSGKCPECNGSGETTQRPGEEP